MHGQNHIKFLLASTSRVTVAGCTGIIITMMMLTMMESTYY